MSALGQTAIAIGLAAAAAMAAGPSAAGPLPTHIAALRTSGATDVIRVQFADRDFRGGDIRHTRPPVPFDLAERLAERGYYPFARYPYYLPYYYYSYPRYSSYEYVHEWYYAPFYRHSGRPY